MAFIGTIAVGLVATTSQFQSGLQKGLGYLKSFSSSASNVLTAMGTKLQKSSFSMMLAGMDAGAINKSRVAQALLMGTGHAANALGAASNYAGTLVAGLGRMIAGAGAAALGLGAAFLYVAKKGFDANLELAKMGRLAERLGTTQAKFAGLQEAAETKGLDPSEMSHAVMQMTRHLAEAKYKGGETAQVVNALGLRLDELSKMDSADAFVAIATQIQKLPDEYARVEAANKIFGRSGIEMMAMLRMKTEDYRKALDDAYATGKAQSAEAVKGALKMSETWREMKDTLSGMWTQVGSTLGPLIGALVSGLTYVLKFVQLIGLAFKEGILAGIWLMVGAVELITKNLTESLDVLAKLPAALGGEGFKAAAAAMNAIYQASKSSEESTMKRMRETAEAMRAVWTGKGPAGEGYKPPDTLGKPEFNPGMLASGKRAEFGTTPLSRIAGGLPVPSGRQEVRDPFVVEALNRIYAKMGPRAALVGG